MPFTSTTKNGLNRRTLRFIDHYPTPEEILTKVSSLQSDWDYRGEREDFLKARDRALSALLYVGAIRISEARRLIKAQFLDNPFRVIALKLSKAERRSKTTGKLTVRKDLYRKEIRLATEGPRGELCRFIKEYLELIPDPETKLFPIKNPRIYQIINNKLGVPPHWLRAFGENELYERWDFDLIAVANYMSVDARTLVKYIHRTPKKYLNRE
jgi:hypothetical protein